MLVDSVVIITPATDWEGHTFAVDKGREFTAAGPQDFATFGREGQIEHRFLAGATQPRRSD